MNEDIGKNLKKVSYVNMALGILGALIVGITMMANEQVGLGLGIMLGGSFVVVVCSMLIYGFGHLIMIFDGAPQDKTQTLQQVPMRKLINDAENQAVKSEVEKQTETSNNDRFALNGKCAFCGRHTSVNSYKLKDDMGIRYRDLCDECYAKWKAENTK